MKFLLVALVLVGMMSCTPAAQKPSALCDYTTMGLTVAMGSFVKELGTCNATKLTNKVLDIIKCPEIAQKSNITADLKIVCPYIVPVVVGLSATELQALDCDPATVTAKIQNLCNFIPAKK